MKVEQDLYRATKRNRRDNGKIQDTIVNANGEGCLYPDYVGFARKDGTVRKPDVTTFTDVEGQVWIMGVNDLPSPGQPVASTKEGVSLTNKPGKFGYDIWCYLLLPEGTPVPDPLDIKQTGSDKSHFSIRCKNRMRRDAYEGELNNLARAAIARAVELSRQVLVFSEE